MARSASGRDCGEGSSPAAAPVFDFFWQADASTTRRQGGGPWLAIVRHLVERHGGHSAASPPAREGATFTVPAARAATKPTEEQTPSWPRAGVAACGERARRPARLAVRTTRRPDPSPSCVPAGGGWPGPPRQQALGLLAISFPTSGERHRMPERDGYDLSVNPRPGHGARLPAVAGPLSPPRGPPAGSTPVHVISPSGRSHERSDVSRAGEKRRELRTLRIFPLLVL